MIGIWWLSTRFYFTDLFEFLDLFALSLILFPVYIGCTPFCFFNEVTYKINGSDRASNLQRVYGES